MLRKVSTSPSPRYEKLRGTTVFLLLFLVSGFIRFPFFFRDYIDRDESTFILMGQSWVDGFLPYTELWDLKPPLTFFFFAGIIYAFGKSFLAIRFFGVLLVSITAYATYLIGKDLSSKRIGFWVAMACVALQSLFGSLQGVMSEHICMAFFMGGLYLLLKQRGVKSLVLSGLLMGLAVMTKMNISYAVLLLGVHVVYEGWKRKDLPTYLGYFTMYGLGVLSIILLTLAPYYFSGRSLLWWESVVLAPLAYAGAPLLSHLKLAPVFLFTFLFLLFAWKKQLLDLRNNTIQILLIAIFGVLFSFIQVGKINSHYLIQLYPMLIILVGIVVSKLTLFQRIGAFPYLSLLLFLIPMESYLEYGNIVRNKLERGTFYNGEGFTVPQYLGQHSVDTKNILFLGYHIGYWMLDQKPPTKSVTHPSSVCREELFRFYGNFRKTAVEELHFIMEKIQPRIVVTRKNKLIFDKKEVEENAYMENYLKANYRILDTVDHAIIYQRLQ